MRAKDVMSNGVMSVTADATVLEAAELLVNTRVSAMPVLDGQGCMIGIVSEADLIGRPGDKAGASELLEALAHGPLIGTPKSSPSIVDIMSRDVIVVDAEAPLATVAELMMKHRVKRLPVMRGRDVVGMVSRVDLLQAMISATSPASPSHIPPDAPPTADDVLRRDVSAAVQGQAWSLARRADVVVTEGVVHLWGTAPTVMVSKAYGVAAAAVPGVRAVRNHMHVPA